MTRRRNPPPIWLERPTIRIICAGSTRVVCATPKSPFLKAIWTRVAEINKLADCAYPLDQARLTPIVLPSIACTYNHRRVHSRSDDPERAGDTTRITLRDIVRHC